MGNVDVRSTKTLPTTVQAVGQLLPVVMIWAGSEDEIVSSAAVIEAAVSVAAVSVAAVSVAAVPAH